MTDDYQNVNRINAASCGVLTVKEYRACGVLVSGFGCPPKTITREALAMFSSIHDENSTIGISVQTEH